MNTTLTREQAAELLAPARNRYFYGKLLDADHLQLEQSYFLEMGRLVNRLALGKGVLCGLRVAARDGKVAISPGVAVDGLGREILVTESVTIDPWSLDEDGTDEQPKSLVLLLCYHECDAEPAPVLVADCELREECVPGVVRERYLVRAMDAADWRPEGMLDERVCRTLFGGAVADPAMSPWGARAVVRRIESSLSRLGTESGQPHPGLRELLCDLVRPSCKPLSECVPIALVTRDFDPDGAVTLSVDECAVRTPVYSNALLLELILCLAERMEECCERRVRVKAPVITAMYPAPAEVVEASEYNNTLEGAAFTLTFDHEMSNDRLQAPNDWLRVLVAPVLPDPTGPNAMLLLPLELRGTEQEGDAERATFRYTAAGKRALNGLVEKLKPTALQVGVVIRSDDLTQIADTQDPPELLDADFAGTALPRPLVRELLWLYDAAAPATLPITATSRITLALPAGTPTPPLPSGNGIEGGLFHAWFEIHLTSS